MTEFEYIFISLLIPITYVFVYIAGKVDLISMTLRIFAERVKKLDETEECETLKRQALEKQIAKKPLPIITDDNEFICVICPTCQQIAVEVDDAYCRKCGQKILLDWGNEDAE